MDRFKETYPDFVPIEEHIRRARLERSLAMAQLIADSVDYFSRGWGRGVRALVSGFTRLKGDAPLTLPTKPAAR
jgi:hypothetical protein